MAHFEPFSPKMTYFDQIDPINDIFDQIFVHKPDWNNFEKLFGKKLFYHFPTFWHMTSFWPPKWLKFDQSPKITYFHVKLPISTKFNPLMTYLTTVMLINVTPIIYPDLYSKYFLTNICQYRSHPREALTYSFLTKKILGGPT